jgi:hypothetical protein
MRKVLMVSAVLAVFAATNVISSAAFANRGTSNRKVARVGTVTTVDQAAKTFTCHGKTADVTYHMTDTTMFLIGIGGKAGSWSDVKVGETIQVRFYSQDQNFFADRVTIIGQ